MLTAVARVTAVCPQASEVAESLVDAARDAQSKAQTAAAVAKTTTGGYACGCF